MEHVRWLDDIGRSDLAVAGGKGANLGELTRAGFDVPWGFVVTTRAYHAFLSEAGLADAIAQAAGSVVPDDPASAQAASRAIATLFDGADVPADLAAEVTSAYGLLGAGSVAVRSSATAEDLAEASFAGQQETFLDVVGAAGLNVAIKRCWASLWTDRALAYRARLAAAGTPVAAGLGLAVVVQRLVPALAAGVMFTANPANGRRHETVIDAVWGLGEAVVSGTVSPDSIVVADGRVASRDTADKAERVVATGSGARVEQVPADARETPALTDSQAVALAALGRRIEAHFGVPQDIEWALSDGRFAVLQARPITALPPEVGDVPTGFAPPRRDALYFRASIIEQLPDPLTPLFADLAAKAVPGTLRELLEEFMPGVKLPPGAIEFVTVNGWAFYEYAKDVFWAMLRGTPAALPYVFGSKVPAERRWAEQAVPRYRNAVTRWAQRAPETLSSTQLLAGAAELLWEGAAYYTNVQTIVPQAASAEIAFTRLYDKTARRAGDPPATTFLTGFESEPIRSDHARYDLAQWAKLRPGLAQALASPALRTSVPGRAPAGVSAADWVEFRERFAAYLDRYGHTVYNLDFANPVPADDPAPVLEALRFYLGDDAPDPAARQARLAAAREAATAALWARLDPVRRRLLAGNLARAQTLAPVREDALALCGLAWPTIRRLLRELGERLDAAGAIPARDDVFWLTGDEVSRAGADLDSAPRTRLPSLAAVVAKRKATWRGQRLAKPPQYMPQDGWMSWFSGLYPAHEGAQTGRVLKGLGGSPGAYTGLARLLRDPDDFASFQPGEVLVAGITTPAYTPLFAMAGAVITDVGGALSHSSIVAREYGIPAVLGTGSATTRIATGDRVHVDGDAGLVTLLDELEDEPIPVAKRRWAPLLAGAAGVGAVSTAAIALIRRRRPAWPPNA